MKLSRFIVKHHILILIFSLILLVPAWIGMNATRINYDMLTYLPEDIETMRGQEILFNEFGKGAFSFIITEGLTDKEVSDLRKDIETIDHVDSAIWYDSFIDLSVPKEILPDKLKDVFISGDATMIAVFFDTSSSADETIEAIENIRKLCDNRVYVSGISALVTDLKNLAEREEPIYVGIAILCALLAMLLLTDSWLIPFVFLAGIGVTILYNLGSNYFIGEISYITKALAAVLQLAVTMDYSIFLWHAYCSRKQEVDDNKEAMSLAIRDTALSVAGSSLTTIAGFLARVTILPSLILLFDKPLTRTMHRSLIPDMSKASACVVKHYWFFLLAFAVILVPAAIGYSHTPVYYDFTKILSGDDLDAINEEDMQFLTAKNKLAEYFNVATTHMILCDDTLPAKDARIMMDEIRDVPGVTTVLGLNSVLGGQIPEDFIPSEITETLKNGGWQLILINSEYAVSTDDVNHQIDRIQEILKRWDPDGMLIGEAPCTKDLIEITDKDFSVVSWVSIGFVFIIILLTLRSLSLPVILVTVIEFAIFINLGIPYFTDFTMPFIAPICISTIQLGSTVDYGILLTTRYKELRKSLDKRSSITKALSYAMPSVLVSALSFFAATFGVGIYTDIDLISSMCNLLARGAIVSMFSVLLILPSLLMLTDGIVTHTTLGINRN